MRRRRGLVDFFVFGFFVAIFVLVGPVTVCTPWGLDSQLLPGAADGATRLLSAPDARSASVAGARNAGARARQPGTVRGTVVGLR